MGIGVQSEGGITQGKMWELQTKAKEALKCVF